MALDTYANLQAAVVSWLHRSDLAAQIPDFITLAEAQMDRRIKSRRKIIRSAATIDAEFVAVPSDFGGTRAFRIIDGCQPTLTYKSPEQMADLKDRNPSVTGEPRHYSIVGDEFEFFPVPGGSYDAVISYYASLPALSSTNPSNWILAKHPDAYLYGALLQAAPYIKDDERIAVWGQGFSTIIDDINAQSLSESLGGAMSPTPGGHVV